jgi:hypothetical protein
MPSAGFEPVIPKIKGLEAYALDRTATGIGFLFYSTVYYRVFLYYVIQL